MRRNRGAALQILSSTNPPVSQEVRDIAAAQLGNGQKFETTDDVNEYVFSFDVIKETKDAIAAAASGSATS